MTVYTYVSNLDPSDHTGRIVLRGGALVVLRGQSADITSDEYAELYTRYNLVLGGVSPVPPSPIGEVMVDGSKNLLGPDGAVLLAMPSVPSGGSSPFTAIGGDGHSWMYGDYATGLHGYLAKLGTMLGLTPTNRGIPGAYVACDNQAPNLSGGGWVSTLQNLPRGNGGAPYLQASSLEVVDFGQNDLAQFGGGATSMGQIKSAIRSILSRIRAAGTGVFEDTDSSVSYSGFTSLSSTIINSGSSVHYASANGSTVTITVPSDFPGGTIALGLVAQYGITATHTFTVDGVAAGSLNTAGLAGLYTGKTNPNCNGVVQRFTNLAPGAHTIVDTVSAVGTIAYFDYWQVEAPEPPTILLLNQPRLLAAGYNVYTESGTPFTPTDAMVGQLNVALRQVAAEFDDKVIVVELDALMGANATYFATTAVGAPGPAHPNDAGHSLIATACLRAVQSRGIWLPAFAIAS